MLAAARTVIAFGIILQAAGFAKFVATANYFGAGPALDAYYLGSVVPTFLVGISTGILQTGFVPVYVRTLARGDVTAARALCNMIITWTFLALSAIALLLTVTRGLVLPLLAQDMGLEGRRNLAAAFVWLVWTAPVNAVADAAALLLNAHGRFVAAAGAPVLNAIVGTLILVALRGDGIDALVWSLLAGLATQLAVVLFAVRLAGIRLRPEANLPAALPRVLGTVALPAVVSMILANVVPAFVQAVAARAGTGAVSAMGYAARLHNALVQAVILSVSAVLLPHFSRLLAEGKNTELRNTLERVFAGALLFAAAAFVLVAAGGQLIVRILLERGKFQAGDAHQVAEIWLALTAGLLGATWSIFLARLFQAQQRLWFVVALGGLSVVLNVGLAYSLLPRWGVVGIAIANAISYTVVMVIAHLRAGRILGPVLRQSSVVFLARAALANGAAYTAAVWLGTLLSFSPIALVAAQLAVVAAANIAVSSSRPLAISLRALVKI
jgi:putative peptidoglycan lipid II flippase